MRLGITATLILILVFALPTSAYADKSYGLPTLNSNPRKADILKNEGGNFTYRAWKMIVAPETFPYDIYFQRGCWKKTFPMHIGRYWQLTDICEFRPRPHFRANKAAAVAQRSWIISYHYDDSELTLIGGIAIPENSLKMVFSDDHGESWTMMKSSVVDVDNNTISAITDDEGGYMVMGGFVNPKTFYNYKEVKGVSTVRGYERQTPEPVPSNPVLTFIEYVAFVLSYLF